MYVLGIETSCDETSAAVVKDGRVILSNIVASSLRFHKKYGGVIPEIASRMQLETIAQVTEAAIKKAGIKSRQIGLINVTSGPGLPGSLLVGIGFAKALSLSLGIPLLGVNHVHSHIYANFLNGANIKLPFMALVVSGGHTALFFVRDFTKLEIVGSTQDDACGEAFDKVAKILGLGYPGGPLIERLAKRGDPKKIKFRCSGTKNIFDFSFSGIKTAVLYYCQKLSVLSHQKKSDIAASFQETVVDALVDKSLLACSLKNTKKIIVGGGVAMNNRLREKFLLQAEEKGVKCFFPSKGLCTDNAAMVAGFGYRLFRQGKDSDLALSVELN